MGYRSSMPSVTSGRMSIRPNTEEWKKSSSDRTTSKMESWKMSGKPRHAQLQHVQEEDPRNRRQSAPVFNSPYQPKPLPQEPSPVIQQNVYPPPVFMDEPYTQAPFHLATPAQHHRPVYAHNEMYPPTTPYPPTNEFVPPPLTDYHHYHQQEYLPPQQQHLYNEFPTQDYPPQPYNEYPIQDYSPQHHNEYPPQQPYKEHPLQDYPPPQQPQPSVQEHTFFDTHKENPAPKSEEKPQKKKNAKPESKECGAAPLI